MKKLLLFLTISNLMTAQNILELNPSNFPVTIPCGFTEFNNKLCYVGVSQAYGRELFATDGTAAGNQIFADVSSTYFNQPYPEGNGFFLNNAQSSDGKLCAFNGKMYFEGKSSPTGYNFRLWSSDGTVAGLTNIAPTAVYGQVRYFKEFNGRLYFTALGYDTGVEVWSTDGTTAGTVLLKDINPSPSASSVNINDQSGLAGKDPLFTVFNNRLYFVANDGVHGNEIWSTDGTTAGTSMLIDLVDGPSSAFFEDTEGHRYQNFVIFDNKMWFNAVGTVDFESPQDFLYSTDGTSAGTTKFQIPMPAGVPTNYTTNHLMNITGFTLSNNKLYIAGRTFRAGDFGNFGNGIWQTDGTTANTTLLKYFYGIRGVSGLNEDEYTGTMREFNGEYYFLGTPNTHISGNTRELWKLNPVTNNFTVIVPRFDVGQSSFLGGDLVSEVYNNRLYFVQNDANPGIFSTDGTAAGTIISARNNTSNNQNQQSRSSIQAITSFPDQLKTVGNSMYFAAGFDNATASLWRITNPALGIESIAENKLAFKLYPNPTANNINLSFKYNLKNASLKITSITGQIVLEKNNLDGTEFNFDVANLHQGIYIIQISDENSSLTTKFIKK